MELRSRVKKKKKKKALSICLESCGIGVWLGTSGVTALRGRLKRSARAVQLFGRLAVLEILGAPRGIMVTRSGGFEF